MAKYYMNGYTPPEGVNSASKVKEYQRQLGVKADGIWGPDTDAAYRASLNRSAQRQAQSRSGFDWGDSGRNEAFDGYYNAIRNSLSVPTVTVKAPSAGEVKDMWSGVLRPSADAAIERRSRAAEREMAEIDADAVSRGMGQSSYVTSVKARQMEEAQDDISDIEAQYGAALAEKIYDTLYKYDQMSLNAQQYNAEAHAAAQKTALSMASDWYNQYLSQQNAAIAAAAKGSSSKSSKGGSGSKKSSLSREDYTEYVRNLTAEQRRQLFSSENSYWSSRREEIYSALGKTLYDSLKKKYGGKGGAYGCGKKDLRYCAGHSGRWGEPGIHGGGRGQRQRACHTPHRRGLPGRPYRVPGHSGVLKERRHRLSGQLRC